MPVIPVASTLCAKPASLDHKSLPMILNLGSSVSMSMRTRSIAPGAAR